MNTRFNGGVLPLLDSWIRKVDPDRAQGGKYYSNYTWHGDQDPSHPWWNGTQNCDVDLSDMRFSKLNTSWGKNFVENKMPEAHWKLECIERGARVVVITPEYNPTAYRADYWIPVRPETDAANFLGACKIIIDENMQDIDYIKQFTDFPILVRTDTLQYLDPRDVIADYKFPDFSKSYSGRVQALKPDQIDRLGGMMVWDLNKKAAGPAASRAGRLPFCGKRHRSGPDRDLPRQVAQWSRSGRGLDLPDVPGAPAGLRSGHGPSDYALAEGFDRAVGAGLREL